MTSDDHPCIDTAHLRAAAGRGTDELRALADGQRAARAAASDATADEVAAWAVAHLRGATSPSPASMAGRRAAGTWSRPSCPGVDVLFLDTGYHFAETSAPATRSPSARCRDHRRRAAARRPSPSRTPSTAPRLTTATRTSAAALRKVEPLARQPRPATSAWVTGVRRDEAPTRADTPLVTWDDAHGLVKVNPLAAWTSTRTSSLRRTTHACPSTRCCHDGYPSIGCAPCTRRVAPARTRGPAAGPGTDKTECGLHT